jgi:hypothetical protein
MRVKMWVYNQPLVGYDDRGRPVDQTWRYLIYADAWEIASRYGTRIVGDSIIEGPAPDLVKAFEGIARAVEQVGHDPQYQHKVDEAPVLTAIIERPSGRKAIALLEDLQTLLEQGQLEQ